MGNWFSDKVEEDDFLYEDEGLDLPDFTHLLKEEVENLTVQSATEYLQWVQKEKNLMAIKRSYGFREDLILDLWDIKVRSKGPDDKVYMNPKNVRIREQITRGNVLINRRGSEQYWLFQGFKKFSGMTEQDDDDLAKETEDRDNQNGSNQDGSNSLGDIFFEKSLDSSKYMAILEKENGKAGHFAVFDCDGERFFLGGSKNVHVIFQTFEDLQEHDNDTLHVQFCNIFLTMLNSLDLEKRKEFEDVLQRTQLMANFEIMLTNDQHVVDYQLDEPLPVFLAFTSRNLENSKWMGKSLHPISMINWVKNLGIPTPKSSLKSFTKAKLTQVISAVRPGQQTEGCVIYFMDEDWSVIGLWKIKSIWYILYRAIREKLSNAKINKKHLGYFNGMMEKRLRELRTWLQLDDDEVKRWRLKAHALFMYLHGKVENRLLDPNRIHDTYAVHLREFIEQYQAPKTLQLDALLSKIPYEEQTKSKKRKRRAENHSSKKRKVETKKPVQSKKSKSGFKLNYL